MIHRLGELPDADTVAATARMVILEAAQAPPVIVVGHGAQCIFQDRVGAFHVRLIAPLADRVRRLQARFGWDTAFATTEAKRFDADRRIYTARHYSRDWNDPTLYDVQINTGRISLDETIEFIVHAVEQRRH